MTNRFQMRYNAEPQNTPADQRHLIRQEFASLVQSQSAMSQTARGSIHQLAVNIPVVTSLPVSPQDGEEVRLVVDDGVGGVFWNLRYRANEPDATRRWKFLGGSALFSEVTTLEGTASTSYTELATSGPGIRIPLPGDYDISIGCMAFPGAAGIAYMSYQVDATAASDDDACRLHVTATQGSITRTRRKTELPGPVDIVARFRTTAGTSQWQERWMSITPIRVGRP